MQRGSCPLWFVRKLWRQPAITSLLYYVHQKRIPHCPIRMFIRGMDDKPRRLVDDEQVVILVDDRYSFRCHE